MRYIFSGFFWTLTELQWYNIMSANSGDQLKMCLTEASFGSFWKIQLQNLNHFMHIVSSIEWVMARIFKSVWLCKQ